jgi:hypothetical protein
MRSLNRTPIIGLIAAAVLTAAVPAYAQSKLEAQYTVYLSGLPLGKGNWTVDVGETQYSAAVSGATTGLIKMISNGTGSSASRGTIADGKVSSTYTSTIRTSKKTDQIQLSVVGGNAKPAQVDPPIDEDPERIQITDAMRQGVLDPMAASLISVPGTGNPVSPEACSKSSSVYDGRLRYDLKLAFKRMETVRADKGYAGPAVVCALYFTPVGGHIPSRATVKYLAGMRDMEIWLAPITGTRVMVPFRVQLPTPVGTGLIEADQFVVTQSSRAANKTNKTQ